jgi:hypothetical protein
MGSDVRLTWNSVPVPDLHDYAVYRATVAGVAPSPINFLSSVDDTTLIDNNAPTGTLYYIVTAVDVHENESSASNEASVSGPTDVGRTPTLSTLTLLPNFPNPFNGSTTLRIGLVTAAPISIRVYDAAGRRVRSLRVNGSAGWQEVALFGIDDAQQPLASGIYFCRVSANGVTTTRKMAVMK